MGIPENKVSIDYENFSCTNGFIFEEGTSGFPYFTVTMVCSIGILFIFIYKFLKYYLRKKRVEESEGTHMGDVQPVLTDNVLTVQQERETANLNVNDLLPTYSEFINNRNIPVTDRN
ncbi:hypothetical protein SNEBB_004346 [Seison nebaliae]|nr:hypothetical protein SNEBB_004346 [Seison nebaliae]